MRNLSKTFQSALRLRLAMQKHGSVGEALSPYAPVGWCGGIQVGGSDPVFVHDGLADIAAETAVTQDTIFRVASISKVFGAAAALRLVGQNRLSLDADIRETLGFATAKTITLRQLITHTAALDDAAIYDEVLGRPDAPLLDEVLNRSFLPYEPGTRFRYSNLGAGVVGMMVEAASGMLFDDYVRSQFFTPHGIDASFHPQRIAHRERMANCYYIRGRKLAYDAQAIAATPLDEAPDPMRHYYVPAGKLMISAPDLLSAFARLAREDSGLFVRQSRIGSVRCDAGRGLGVAIVPAGVFTSDEMTFWGHQGTAYGAVCEAWMDLQNETVVVLLTNGAWVSSVGPLQKVGQTGIAALLDQYGPDGYTKGQ